MTVAELRDAGLVWHQAEERFQLDPPDEVELEAGDDVYSMGGVMLVGQHTASGPMAFRQVRREAPDGLARNQIIPSVAARTRDLPGPRGRKSKDRLSLHEPIRLPAQDWSRAQVPTLFRRHALRHYIAPTWLRLGAPINEVAEYLGDDQRAVLTTYAHVLGEAQRRDFASRLAAAETESPRPVHSAHTFGSESSATSPNRDGSGLGI